LLGLPSVALPMGLDGGLPTSVQIYADSWREDLCLEAAEIIERAAPRVMPVDPHTVETAKTANTIPSLRA
jgi:amidase